MKKLLIGLAMLSGFSTAAMAQAAYVPIPQLRVEAGPPPPPPGPPSAYVLAPGTWQWNGRSYDWIGRHWVPRQAGYSRWIPAHWGRGPAGGWRWVPAHWGR